MRRLLLVAVLAALMIMASAGAAFAGEWNPGRGYIHGDTDAAPLPAASDCAYSGRDDPDVEDDSNWEATPAGGLVQSPGQFMLSPASFGPGVPGIACNPSGGGGGH